MSSRWHWRSAKHRFDFPNCATRERIVRQSFSLAKIILSIRVVANDGPRLETSS
jgi:hypothetical protein